MKRRRVRDATIPEYELMKSCSQILKDTFALHPDRVKDALTTNGLITKYRYDYETTLSGDNATSILVSLVLERVREHPEQFHQFIDLFESLRSWTDTLVEQFDATYAETKGVFTQYCMYSVFNLHNKVTIAN